METPASFSNKRKQEVDLRARAKKIQDEPETSCGARSKEVLKKDGSLLKVHSNQPKDAPNGQS